MPGGAYVLRPAAVTWAGSTLVTDGVADLRWAGQSISEDVLLFRAATVSVKYRGGDAVTISFTAFRTFASLKAAGVFEATHFGSLAKEGDLTFDCGRSGDRLPVYMLGAVLVGCESARAENGLSVVTTYSVRGPPPQSDIPPPTPGSPDPEEESPVYRRNRVTIPSAAESVAVTFSSPFSTTPFVTASLEVEPGDPLIDVQIQKDSVDVNGFTALLGAPTPNANYRLVYQASN